MSAFASRALRQRQWNESAKTPIVDFHRLTPEVGSECDYLLQSLDLGLIYGSHAYLRFLEQALPGTSLVLIGLRARPTRGFPATGLLTR